MREPVDLVTVIFALLAVFVVWKLRSILGTRTGHEAAPPPPRRDMSPDAGTPASGVQPASNVVRLPGSISDTGAKTDVRRRSDVERWKNFVEPDSKAWSGLEEITNGDKSFSPPDFMGGARAAYEMIVTAFAAGDKKTLQPLLDKDVLESFSTAINERQERGEKVETTFVSLDKASIVDAHLRGSIAQISVRFASKLITATRDKAGVVIGGNPEQIVDLIDIWTFARETGSPDPNWKLVATETEH